MANNTTRLGLLKKDPATDGNDTFNIQTMLNDNWDKIDQRAALLDPETGKVPADQLSVDTSDLATKQELATHLADKVNHITAAERTAWNSKSNFSGSYNDLTNKPTIPALNNTVTSTSTVQAATANAVKIAHDKAVSAENLANAGTSQTGVYTDTTTTIQPLALYTKRIPLTGNPKRGTLRLIRSSRQYFLFAQFTTIRAETVGVRIDNGSSSATYVGLDGSGGDIFGNGEGNVFFGVNIQLVGAWIDGAKNELVLEFKNRSTTTPATFNLSPTPGTNTGLIWEVS
ncbi:tail fiber protein [Bacillus sp. JJ1474]|uniref:tail fiber protein n=1 Tax=Bacillus sp. JJ1474 TaxID=3122955 RepID=UPI002FFF646D